MVYWCLGLINIFGHNVIAANMWFERESAEGTAKLSGPFANTTTAKIKETFVAESYLWGYLELLFWMPESESFNQFSTLILLIYFEHFFNQFIRFENDVFIILKELDSRW